MSSVQPFPIHSNSSFGDCFALRTRLQRTKKHKMILIFVDALDPTTHESVRMDCGESAFDDSDLLHAMHTRDVADT